MDYQLIQSLVDDGDYHSAKQWYLENGKNQFLKSLVSDDSSGLMSKRLFRTISVEIETFLLVSGEPDGNSVNDYVQSESQSQSDTEELMSKLKYKAGQFFKSMKESRLGIFSEDINTRRNSAIKTLQCQRQNRETWLDIEYLDSNGHLPHDKEMNSYTHISHSELTKLYNQYKNYVYKMSKKKRDGKASDHVLKTLEERRSALLKIEKEISRR